MMLMDDPERSWVTGAELVGINRGRPNLVSMVAWDYTAAGHASRWVRACTTSDGTPAG